MSTIAKLNKAILQYIDTPKTDFALMVNGDWGSGKTFYIKHQLFPELQTSKPDLKLIYLSLFGVSSTSDLNNKIFLAAYPILDTRLAKLTGVIGKTLLSKVGIGTDQEANQILIKSLLEIDENSLIVFDDLERLDKKLLIEILGFINQIVEHSNVKCIISANESELATDIVHAPEYVKYIEKVIRHKLQFEVDFANIAGKILSISKIEEKYHENILLVFQKAEHTNLRTLQFVSSLLSRVLQTLLNFKHSDHTEKITELTIRFLTSLSIENKIGRMNYVSAKKLVTWSFNRPSIFSQINFDNVDVIEKGNIKKIVNRDTKDLQEYFDRYYEPHTLMYFDSMVEYLESGYWDENVYKEEVSSIINYYEKTYGTPSMQAMLALFNSSELEDSKLNSVIEQVLDSVKAGDYPLGQYTSIYTAIAKLIASEIYDYKLKQLYDVIAEGIANCKDTEAIPYLEEIPDSINIDSNISSLHKKVIERNSEISKKSNSKESHIHFEEFFSSPLDYSNKYLSIQNNREAIPCFHFSHTPREFLKRYDELTNRKKTELHRVFFQRQKHGVNMDRTEMKWMRKLKAKVEDQIIEEKPSITRRNKEEFSKILEKLIVSFEALEAHFDN